MRKLLVIWLFLIIFLVGCVEPTPPGPVVDELKVSEVVDSIDILYSDMLRKLMPDFVFPG